MSIAFERTGLLRGISVYDSPETVMFAGDRRIAAETSSSSSIGNNSDTENGDGEVQSEYKGTLDCFDALEDVLPVKKGMSNFYNGKSKSFTSLADVVSCSSIKEIVKPENALTRKRKNLIAHATFWDKNRNLPPINSSGSLSKKPTNSNRSTSTTSSNESHNSDTCNSNGSSPILKRPPLHPQSRISTNEEALSSPTRRNFSPWRSFSLSDLQGAAAVTPSTPTVLNNGEENHIKKRYPAVNLTRVGLETMKLKSK